MSVCYLYNAQTKEFVTKLQTNVTIPGYKCTNKEIPSELIEESKQKHKVLIFDERVNEWKVVDDYRGVWYSKSDKSKIVIDKVGVKVDLTKYTNKKPCEFCIWSEEDNDWIFSLELYKEHAINKLLEQFYSYFLNKEPLIHQTAITGIMVRTLTILSTNKNLTDEQIDKLSQIIQDCDFVFSWISKVTNYELEIEQKIKNAQNKEEIDTILSEIDFEQFNRDYRYVTIGDKITYLSQITLT